MPFAAVQVPARGGRAADVDKVRVALAKGA